MRKLRLITLINVCIIFGLLIYTPPKTQEKITAQEEITLTESTKEDEICLFSITEVIPDYKFEVTHIVNIGLNTLSDNTLKEKGIKQKISEKDLQILYRIVEAEATGHDIEAKKNVCCNIIARMNSDEFPDDVESVIFQKRQYSPISDGRYYTVEITEETIQAVDEVLRDGVTHDYTYFFNLDHVKSSSTLRWIERDLEYGFTDSANHSYYKDRK